MGLLFTYFATALGSLASLFAPLAGLCVYVCFAIIKPSQFWAWSVPSEPYSEIVAIALIIGWALKRFGSWPGGRAFGCAVLFAAFLGWAALSAAIAATNKPLAWYFVETLLKVLVPFVIGLAIIDTPQKLKILAWTILGSAGYVAFEENLYYYTHGFVAGGEVQNGIAHEMAAGVGLALFLGLYSRTLWEKWSCFAIAGLLFHVCLIHMSRGAMVGLSATALVTVITMPRTRETATLAGLAIVGVLVVAGPSVVREFETVFAPEEQRDSSAQSRLDLWADMWDVALEHPIIGIGPSHFPLISYRYGWEEGKQGHGLWVQYCAELGLPGGMLAIGMYAWCMGFLWRMRHGRAELDRTVTGVTLGVLASLSGWVVEAQFGTFWSIETPYYLLLLGASALRLRHFRETMAKVDVQAAGIGGGMRDRRSPTSAT